MQAVVYSGFDVPLSRVKKSGERWESWWFVLYFVMGGVVGGLSLLVIPHVLIHSASLRIANLFVAPVVAVALSWGWRHGGGLMEQ